MASNDARGHRKHQNCGSNPVTHIWNQEDPNFLWRVSSTQNPLWVSVLTVTKIPSQGLLCSWISHIWCTQRHKCAFFRPLPELNENMQIKHLFMGCNLEMSVTKELPSSPSLGSHIFTSRLGKPGLNIHVSEGSVHATFGEILTAADPCDCIIPEEIHGYTPTKPLTQTPAQICSSPPARAMMVAEKAAPWALVPLRYTKPRT